MLNFTDVRSADLDKMQEYLALDTSRKSNSVFGTIYLWSTDKGKIAFSNGFLFFKDICDDETFFHFPVGNGDIFAAIKEIDAFCAECGIKPIYLALTENEKDILLSHYGDGAAVSESRDWADYLYNYEDLTRLSGKKYHGQRNHINKFISLYPDYEFKEYSDAMRSEIDAFLSEYYTLQNKESFLFDEEKHVIEFMLNNFEKSKQKGAALFADGKIVAVTFGEKKNDCLHVHFEKALRQYAGSYSMINYLFANFCHDSNTLFINREEDMGDLGLRKAKTDLHPAEILLKYSVVYF